MRPPLATKASQEKLLTGMIGAYPRRPPNSTVSPTSFSDYRDQTDCCGLLWFTIPMAASSAIIPEIVDALGVSRNCDHIQSNGAYAGHGFQLLNGKGACCHSVDHSLILTDWNKRAA